MAFIGIKVPTDVAGRLSMVEAPGERLGQEEMHITLLYLGKKTPLQNVVKAFAVLASLAQTTKPFHIGSAVRTCFPENPDDGVPVIARIQSPKLAEFRAQLARSLDEAGAEYSKKYPDFKPHVTLAYTDKPCTDLKFEPVVWKVGVVTVWGGEEMDDRIVASIELEG